MMWLRFSLSASEGLPEGERSTLGRAWRVGLFPPEPAPKDIYEREEQAEGECEEGDKDNEKVQEDGSPSGGKASKTETESGKEIHPKGKACPFW